MLNVLCITGSIIPAAVPITVLFVNKTDKFTLLAGALLLTLMSNVTTVYKCRV